MFIQKRTEPSKDSNNQEGIIKKKYLSLKTTLSVSLILLILIVSLIIFLFFLRLHEDIIEHSISSKAITVIRMLSAEATPHFIKHEFDYIDEHVKSIANDKDILYAAILDPNGKILLESQHQMAGLPLMPAPVTIKENCPLFIPFKDNKGVLIGYDVYMPIISKNERLGLSRIIISFKEIRETLSHIKTNLIALVCLMAFIEGVLSVFISNIINKPIQDLVKAAKKIAQGDFTTTIPVQSKTEIGLLAQSLNKMIVSIRQYRDKIISKGNELKAILNSMGNGLFTVDKDWRITSFNRAAEHITGYKWEEVRGKTCQEIFKSDVCQSDCPLEKSLMGGNTFNSSDFFIKHKDGRKIPVNVSTSPLKNESGEIIGGVEVFKDLSEIKELQKQLIQADKLSALGQMISGIAHDINNPIGVIHSNILSISEYMEIIKALLIKYRTLIQVLSDDRSGEFLSSVSEIQEYEKQNDLEYVFEDSGCLVEETKKEVHRITNILKDLRDFIHIDVGHLQPVNLNERLDISLHLVKFDKNIKIVKDYSLIPSVYCNVQQIDQVFTNILLNAAQALGKRGEIDIKTWYYNNHVIVQIKDNGPGIPEDTISKIFDPFFTTKEIGEGTGLGLSICYKIVTKHRGRIWVDSTLGKGAEFFVELPIA